MRDHAKKGLTSLDRYRTAIVTGASRGIGRHPLDCFPGGLPYFCVGYTSPLTESITEEILLVPGSR